MLSGTGSNGTSGLRAVKGNGGLTIAQLPETTKFDGMPRNAIASGLVDLVLAPRDMPLALQKYAKHPYVTGPPDAAPQQESKQEQDWSQMNEVLALLRAGVGHDFSHYRKPTMFRRIYRRMGINGIQQMDDYVNHLREQPEELTALFRDMLINVTEFFRDAEAWKALEENVVAPLVQERQDGASIRVWAPGCATGEEAYSLAMLIADQSMAANKRFDVKIFATDAADDVLQTARLGIYASNVAAGVSPERLQKYFVKDGDVLRVSKAIRDMVVFAQHDLIVDPPFSHLDLISCRNLLIYLEPETQQKVIALLHFALNENGRLFLGSGESVAQENDLFEPVSSKWRIYRRIDPARHATIEFPVPHIIRSPVVRDRRPFYLASRRGPLPARMYAPAAVLLGRDNQVLYFHGAAGEYLTQPAGQPTRDVFALARGGLKATLRNLVHEARRQNQAATSIEKISWGPSDERTVLVTVLPLERDEQATSMLLVTFEEQTQSDAPARPGGDKRASPAHENKQLQRELESTTGMLKHTVEELEIANEELQSTNEEMETAQEELQSLNEELNTANSELQTKVESLEKLTNDLTNLVTSTDIATIFLDTQLRIKWFAPGARDLFGLIDSDIGRPIADLTPKFTGDNLLKDAETVLKKLVPLNAEVQSSSGHWYVQRITPYRTSDNRIDGIVVTFTDFTDLQSSRNELAFAQAAFELQLREQAVREQGERLQVVAREVTLAEQRERKRLAQVLHDDLQQVLAATRMRVHAWRLHDEQSAEKDDVASRLADEIETLLGEAFSMGRSLTFELYPPVLHRHGLSAGFKWLAGWMHDKHGLTVELLTDAQVDAATEELRVVVFQAVRELLFNVVKHAGVNSARLQMSLTEDGWLRVEVEDHGAGISPGNGSTATKRESGFGLSNIRERLRLFGGSLEIDSKPGEGTKATIQVPALPVGEGVKQLQPATPVRQARRHQADRQRAGSVIRVVLADDNDLVRQSIVSGLRREPDVEVVGEAADGQAAVEMVRNLRPDVVLLDISMPVMTGVEAAKLITAELPDVRVYGLSLYDDKDMVKQMTEAGASGFLSKAVPISAIVAAIRG